MGKDHMNAFARISKQMKDKIEAKLGHSTLVYYSAYESDSSGLPIDNLDDVAITGKVKFIDQADPFWGTNKTYESEVVENPTWLDIACMADNMIRVTGDTHHQFLEKVCPEKVVYLEGNYTQKKDKIVDGVSIFRFIMGS